MHQALVLALPLTRTSHFISSFLTLRLRQDNPAVEKICNFISQASVLDSFVFIYILLPQPSPKPLEVEWVRGSLDPMKILQTTWEHCYPPFSHPNLACREVQAIEGKKLAESWGATFMESSARENQVLGLKIWNGWVGSTFSMALLGGGDGAGGGIHLGARWYWH